MKYQQFANKVKEGGLPGRAPKITSVESGFSSLDDLSSLALLFFVWFLFLFWGLGCFLFFWFFGVLCMCVF